MPTRRQLLIFMLCCIATGIVTWLAILQRDRAVRDQRMGGSGRMEGSAITEAAQILPSIEASGPLTASKPADNATISRPLPATTPTAEESPVPVKGENDALRSVASDSVFDPEHEETDDEMANGDARVISPSQIKWLKTYLQSIAPERKAPENFHLVQQLVRRIGNYPYEVQRTWVLPDQTERMQRGDCKTKTLWLASVLLRAGYKNVAIVQGVLPHYTKGPGHAWVELRDGQQTYVFDPATHGEVYTDGASPVRDFEVISRIWR